MKKRLGTLLLALLMLLSIVPGQCFAEEAAVLVVPTVFEEIRESLTAPLLYENPQNAESAESTVISALNAAHDAGKTSETVTYTAVNGQSRADAEAFGESIGGNSRCVYTSDNYVDYSCWRMDTCTSAGGSNYTMTFKLVTITGWGHIPGNIPANDPRKTVKANGEIPEAFLKVYGAMAGSLTKVSEDQYLTYGLSTYTSNFTYTITFAPVTYYTTSAQVAAELCTAMKNRKKTVVLYMHPTDGVDLGGVAEAAMAHTGAPTEGDYLKWQYAGYGASALSWSYGGSNPQCFMITYNITGYYTDTTQEYAVDTFVTEFKNSTAIQSATDDYEKIKAIYDWLCTNVVYDYTNLNSPEYMLKHTAYAAAINHTAVCQGYAVLFYRLALECGIDARVIAGKGKGANGWEDHAWNIVKLGGNYYLLDATWDATKELYQKPAKYDWFLKGSESFTSHNPGTEQDTYDYTALGVSSTNYDPQTAVSEQYDLNGGGFDISDLQYLFEYLSTGTVSSIDTKKADVNKDGQVNILDYQALYEAYKVWVSKAA
jgi:hypothetical protein